MKNRSETLISELQTCLVKRCKANPSYSMRAFARNLSLSPSHLSLIMSGKRGITLKTAEKISQALNMSSLKFKKIHMELGPKGAPKVIEADFALVDLDFFNEVDQWYHYAILSLIDTQDFKPDIKWMANRLGVSQVLIKQAVQSLKAQGVLDTSGPQWRQTVPKIKVDNKKVTSATTRFQKSVIDKAKESMDQNSVEARDITSCTMAIDPQLIPVVKDKIAKFRRKLMYELEKLSGDEKTEVYNLAVQFYPLTKETKEKK